jgi:hypothetical protein
MTGDLSSACGYRHDAQGRLKTVELIVAERDRRGPCSKTSAADGVSVEQPRKFELLVNVKAAKGLHLTIPASVTVSSASGSTAVAVCTSTRTSGTRASSASAGRSASSTGRARSTRASRWTSRASSAPLEAVL